MKRIMNAAVLAVLATTVLTACAPTMREVPIESLQNEEMRQVAEKARQEGYNEAMAVANVQIQEKVTTFLRKYKGEMLYLEMVKAGVLMPGQVEMRYMPPSPSDDGLSYVAPTFAWKVNQLPQFVAEESTNWMKRDEANFCYFFLKSYGSDVEASKAMGRMEKPDSVFLTTVAYGDMSGKWSVIGKTVASLCEDNMLFFEERGYKPIRVR